ncbi:MAG: peptide deformylase [Pseudanabaenaceae cyanobacterium bins.68]|nr:peptide deformylase [Pseudanabaenaceae cyanobacterium bins.68]
MRIGIIELEIHSQTPMAELEILQLGSPILRQVAAPVAEIQTPQIQSLLDQMLNFSYDRQAMGLAAPQVGHSLQIMIICSHPNHRYPDAPQIEPLVLINPRINRHSPTQATGWEGCLSIPGWRGQVPRHEWVEISFRDRTDQSHHLQLSGFLARIFQHEYDHLQGSIFLDRLESPSDLYTEAEYFAQLPSL